MKRPLILLTAILAVISPSRTRAAPPEERLGLGARTAAMGGAGTALAEDGTAAYYNPAALTRCHGTAFTGGLTLTSLNLSVQQQNGMGPAGAALGNSYRGTGAMCVRMPFHLAIGFEGGTGFKSPLSLDQSTTDGTPRFALYNTELEMLSLASGLAFEPFPGFSIGLGVALNVSATLSLSANAAILSNSMWSADFKADMSIGFAPLAGVLWAVSPDLKIGAVYRGASGVSLAGSGPISVDVGVQLTIPIEFAALSGYSPRQVAIGASYLPMPDLTLAADFTWYNWSAFSSPFLSIRSMGDSAISREVQFPAPAAARFSDVIVPRLGAELRVLDRFIALRAGYAYHPTPVPTPNGPANLMDAAVQDFTAGLGFHFFGGLTERLDAGFGGLEFDADFFGRVSVMTDTHVDNPNSLGGPMSYSFGGTMWSFGGTTTIAW